VNFCEFATNSRFPERCDLLGEPVFEPFFPRGKATPDGVGTN
jgi:hypothetical protein